VAPVNSRAVALTSTPVGEAEHGPFDVGLVEPAQQGAGGDDGALGQFADAAVEGFVADEDAEQRRRPLASAGAVAERAAISTMASARRWPGVRARSAALGSRPRRPRASARSTSSRAVSRRSSSSATMAPEMGVEDQVPQPHALEALRQGDLAAGVAAGVVGLARPLPRRPTQAGCLPEDIRTLAQAIDRFAERRRCGHHRRRRRRHR
jgi:hypothetical protein